MGLFVHPRVRKKLHDSETSSLTHYKRTSKVGHLHKSKMEAMFWDFEGLPLYEILPPKTTINCHK
jgi:hypothetical protein